jgi:hypothetical protein
MISATEAKANADLHFSKKIDRVYAIIERKSKYGSTYAYFSDSYPETEGLTPEVIDTLTKNGFSIEPETGYGGVTAHKVSW